MNISEQVKSIGEQLGGNYRRPDQDKVVTFFENINNDKSITEYLISTKGLTKETIDHFMLGYDSVTKSITIPVFKRGELIDIKYCSMEPNGKNTGEPKAESWIFNEDGLQKGIAKGSIIVVQNEFDLMSIWQTGSVNVIATSGKDSYGTWIEYIDSIPKAFIAYDNNLKGKESSSKLADRLGTDKCFEMIYPEGINGASEFFKKQTKESFFKLAKDARPYYTHQFKGVGDVINSLRMSKPDLLYLKYLPGVRIEKDWLIVVSGITNIGKTSYVLNLAEELADKNIPTLIMPFERGVESVGGRFLQVKMNMNVDELTMQSDSEWERTIEKCIDMPVYFAVPNIKDVVEIIIKSKRIFDTKVVIIDHIDYLIRNISGNKSDAIGDMLKLLKNVAIEHSVVIIAVSHLKKLEGSGGWKKDKTPGLDDLKGSSSLSQDPECVVILRSEAEGSICVDVQKNKGEMMSVSYEVNNKTGKMGNEVIIGLDL